VDDAIENGVTAPALRRINAQHINVDKLDAAMVDVINQYVRFPLPRHWGGGRTAIADGTHVKLHENNLIGSRHIRYGGYGGMPITADTYIALFTSFISCGVWEAVYILDGLMKNRSAIQPDTLHADTQGQSEAVFGLCRLLGIKLMPRMRGLSDAVFFRPAKSIRYPHIDALFGGEIDWDLIATHARDMIQVVLSIQVGVVMPSMLLRKLGTYNRRSRLHRAFRDGRVERTLFLLRFISSVDVRLTIRAETTKIEGIDTLATNEPGHALDWVMQPISYARHRFPPDIIRQPILIDGQPVARPAKPSMAWHFEDLRFGILDRQTMVFFCIFPFFAW
jgi:TnpA family transposase